VTFGLSPRSSGTGSKHLSTKGRAQYNWQLKGLLKYTDSKYIFTALHVYVFMLYIKKKKRLITSGGKDKYLLVIVCNFSWWVEAFPTRTEKVQTVVHTLLKKIIPRYGIPISIGPDNGPAFVAKVVKQLTKKLKIT
jgi:hypothetical protein